LGRRSAVAFIHVEPCSQGNPADGGESAGYDEAGFDREREPSL
jgi:hypothetical protein